MTNLFRNSSPNALTLQQSVEHTKKRLIERGLQMRQARELAAKGRGNDTEIAHVALGEIVLPKALQTRGVLNSIRQAAVEANIPLDRLRIGSSSNSINPDTGMPEFDEAQIEEPPMEEIVVPGSLITDDPSTNQVIDGLHPSMRYDTAKFINDVKDQTGQQLRIPYPSGFRTIAEQDANYAKGRTTPGTTAKDIVTWAPGGKSYHNYGLAFDITGLNPDGKTVTNNIDFPGIAGIAKERGLAWGGDWASPKTDRPHFERTYGYTTDQLRQMMEPGARYPTIPGQRNR